MKKCLMIFALILVFFAFGASAETPVYSAADLFTSRDLQQTADLSEAVRYTVADGRTKTDPVSFSWYDTAGKKYREAMAEGVAITYVPEEESVTEALVVNREESREGLVPIRLAPSSSARETGLVDPKDPALRITETWRGYARVDDGKKAGWARKEDLE